jgi:hypothetical protein
MAFMLLAVFGAIGFFGMASHQIALIYAFGLFAQYLMAAWAAGNYGKRFVCTVLALTAIG